MPAVPHIVGYQCAGTIREVGEGVTDRQVGQRVVATNLWGSHAERTVVPAILTWPVPDGADIVSVACVPVAFGTARRLSLRVRPSAGRGRPCSSRPAPAVSASPPSSSRSVPGATVIATASSDDRLARLEGLRARPRRRTTRDDDWVDKVRAITGGRGVDLVVDSVGGRILGRQRAVPRVPGPLHQRRQRGPRSATLRRRVCWG